MSTKSSGSSKPASTATPTDCTINPSFTFDAPHCWQIPKSSFSIGDGTTTWPRDWIVTFAKKTGPAALQYTTASTTDYDRCLPGPRSCDLTYSEAGCPPDFMTASVSAVLSQTTAWCCPSVTTGRYKLILGPDPMIWCGYSFNKTGSTYPTSDPVQGATDVLQIRAFTAVFRTLSSSSRSMGSSIATPGSPAVSTVTPPPTSSPLPPSSDPNPPPTSDSGLSSGAKAGIGISVTLLAILLIAGLLFWYRSKQVKKRQRHLNGSSLDDFAAGGANKSELPGASVMVHEAPAWETRVEVAGGTMHPVEAHGRQVGEKRAVEMEGEGLPVEIGPGR
ncbi:hypothetical protein DM02DRAFT_385604 [Periconia macrospinosa]|uniref:Uncharacterized protein n=1 Tax=Periconia macrospinosa TaxID=97972 RepID=A0A2V1DRU3_9PLEO|nr:hypothetical protein DM02DRAFT_385604 [Periconia macrospinosa]